MKLSTLRTQIQVLITVLALPSWALAQTFTGNVSVFLAETLTINEDQQIDFGVLLNEVGTCTMAPNGALSGDVLACNGFENVGLFTISGSPGLLISLSTTIGTANGITFTPTLPNGNSLLLSGPGSRAAEQIIVAGSVDISASAGNGVTQIPYTLTADYN